MSHERLQVDETASDKSDGFWVLIGVSVLELQVDLIGRAVAEGVLRVSEAVARAYDMRPVSSPTVLWVRHR